MGIGGQVEFLSVCGKAPLESYWDAVWRSFDADDVPGYLSGSGRTGSCAKQGNPSESGQRKVLTRTKWEQRKYIRTLVTVAFPFGVKTRGSTLNPKKKTGLDDSKEFFQTAIP